MKSGIFKFLVSFAAIFLASYAVMSFVDTSYEMGGALVKYAYVPPAIKVAVQFWPSRLLVNLPKASFFDAAVVSIFTRDIEENLYPENAFYKLSKDDTPFVVEMNGAYTVVRGVAGAKPNVVRNRSNYPKPITNREDDNNQYNLTHLSTDANVVQDFEEFIVNYAKRQSILENHIKQINTEAALVALDSWHPNGADNIIRTTGANRDASIGQTGTRKSFAREDFVKVAEKFDRMDVPKANRNILLPAELYSDLLNIAGFVDADKIGTPNLIEGFIGRLLGFNIYSRSTVGLYDNTSTPVFKPSGSATATSDNLAALAWHQEFVYRAEGPVKVFANENDAAYDGSVFSAASWFGGQIRKDKAGIISIVQSAGI
jgi:hypothetical protein